MGNVLRGELDEPQHKTNASMALSCNTMSTSRLMWWNNILAISSRWLAALDFSLAWRNILQQRIMIPITESVTQHQHQILTIIDNHSQKPEILHISFSIEIWHIYSFSKAQIRPATTRAPNEPQTSPPLKADKPNVLCKCWCHSMPHLLKLNFYSSVQTYRLVWNIHTRLWMPMTFGSRTSNNLLHMLDCQTADR